MSEHERHIPFERVLNFRDLGGYRAADGRAVRWRRLFRSDAPGNMSETDERKAREELGIVTVIDLREPAIVERGGVASFVEPESLHHIPLLNDAEVRDYADRRRNVPSTGWYLEILRSAGSADGVPRAFSLLAEPSNYPLVFHCSVGKDRAGVLAAVVLGALGIDDEQILQDFEVSEQYLMPMWERMQEAQRQRAEGERGTTPSADGAQQPQWDAGAYSKGTFASPREWMAGVLEELAREHGSVRGYVESQGVDAATIDRVADLLLE